MTHKPNQGPLKGMRVIELAHVMAGPVCGLMLADMGADVVKVEKIDGGDDTRRMLPPDINGEAAAFMMMNRNKRGIALNLKHDKGRQVLERLIKDADVLIENYRHDTMAKLGAGYDHLNTINPGLIYAEISGFGRTGPFHEQGGYDLIAQGMSGLMSATGEGPGRPPVKVGAPVCDITAGILGAMGVSAAYAHKLKTGEGQRVDTSLFEAGITHTYWQSAISLATGKSPGPMGSAHPLSAPYQAFESSDGWLTIGASNQRNWLRLLDVLGNDAAAIAEDARFADNSDRMGHLAELETALTPIFRTRSTADWLQALEAAGIPAGPVLNVKDMHAHPQTVAREMVVSVDHPVAGNVQTIGLPVKFSETPGAILNPAPVFGQHTDEILREIGYAQNEIDDIVTAGAAARSGSKGAAAE